MDIHERIEKLMLERGWSKYRLAREAGLYPNTVYDWFNEKRYTPDRASIELVCLAFGLTQAEFYSGVDETALSGEQIRLLELYDGIAPEKRKVLLDLMTVMQEKNASHRREPE